LATIAATTCSPTGPDRYDPACDEALDIGAGIQVILIVVAALIAALGTWWLKRRGHR